ncbi:MAG: HD domain-containing phosphohydrolase [Pyrinomonadaceae bacterium]
MSCSTHSTGKLVLFVDDDPSLLKLGHISLERAGYRFAGAASGREGLRLACELSPDLILLDYMMPGMSGKEVFAEINADPRLHRTPVIMLTARTGNQAEQRELLEAGLAAYLCKPFGHSELLNVIDNALIMSQIKERNRELETQARQSLVSTVRALISLLAVKDNYTGEHSNMMVDLTESIAQRFQLSDSEVMNFKLGALLHDIGKIGVPESILRKPGRLTPEETAMMRLHVDYGEQAIRGVPHLDIVHGIVKHHHEWWNGSGYPTGLKGETIPLGARIVAVVDAFDAMMSDRPYRQRLPQETAIARLREGAGTQFDAEAVEKLIQCLATYDSRRARTMNLQFLEELYTVA